MGSGDWRFWGGAGQAVRTRAGQIGAARYQSVSSLHVGLSSEWGLGSLRVTLGSGTTVKQVELFLQTLPPLVEKVRDLTRDKQG